MKQLNLVEINSEKFKYFIFRCYLERIFGNSISFEITKINEKQHIVLHLVPGFGLLTNGVNIFGINNIHTLSKSVISIVSKFDELIINNIYFKFKLKKLNKTSFYEIEKIFTHENDYNLFDLLLTKDNIKNNLITKDTFDYCIDKIRNHKTNIHVSFLEVIRNKIRNRIKII